MPDDPTTDAPAPAADNPRAIDSRLPVVAIIGRPNVGKSSLFNQLANRRIAIVDALAGTTRDRVNTFAEIGAYHVELIDTGGIGIVDVADLSEHVETQINLAIDVADLVLFVVDLHAGYTPVDQQIAQRLRRHARSIMLVANKSDGVDADTAKADFFRLGVGDPVCISALHRTNHNALLLAVEARLRELFPEPPPAPTTPVITVTIVGKRNAGKSTFVNRLAKSERVIASEIPGTTRDSVDVRVERNGKVYTIVDTAGLAKAKSVDGKVDFYGQLRADESIARSDVVLFMLDATVDISEVDKRIAARVVEGGKPVVVVVNKWDLQKPVGTATQEWAEYFDSRMPGLTYAPKVFTTALTGRHVTSALDMALMVYKQAASRIPTSQINTILENALALRRPAKSGTRIPRIYYGTQVDMNPPLIVVFVNDPKIFRNDYARYLVNRFREAGVFDEVPLEIVFRGRDRKGRSEEAPAEKAADEIKQREGDFFEESKRRGPRGGPSKKKEPEKRHGRRQGRRFKA